MSSSPAPRPSRVASTLTEHGQAVREKLAAAWQRHVSGVEEQLNAGWRQQMAPVIEERFAELAARVELLLAAEMGQARRDSAEEFNRAIRRLAGAQTEEEWAAALIDSTQPFASRVALFGVGSGSLKGISARGVAVAGLEIPIAPGFAGAIAAAEPVAALRAPGELSDAFAALLGPDPGGKCHLFPIGIGGRVAAVLYTEGDPLDANGLEAVAALAGAFRRPAPEARLAVPDWSQLPREELALHLRAQRFARVRVAEMRLCRSPEVHSGRAGRNLYAALKEDIDFAREAFRRDFTCASPAMPDYFHLELIRTLANDDVGVLGEDYPGPLF
jgi:hypothetical protein